MPKYVQFDPSIDPAIPQHLLAWYDTDFAIYLNRPPMSQLLKVPDDIWARHIRGEPFALHNGQIVPFDISVYKTKTTIAPEKSS